MTSKEAMAIGMKIAESHKAQCLKIIRELGASPDAALHGCLVLLAADIMVAVQDAAEATQTSI